MAPEPTQPGRGRAPRKTPPSRQARAGCRNPPRQSSRKPSRARPAVKAKPESQEHNREQSLRASPTRKRPPPEPKQHRNKKRAEANRAALQPQPSRKTPQPQPAVSAGGPVSDDEPEARQSDRRVGLGSAWTRVLAADLNEGACAIAATALSRRRACARGLSPNWLRLPGL